MVSRGALRDALRTLGALGVVEVRHGSGTYVSQLDPADMVRNFSLTIDLLPLDGLLQLLEIRRVLEAHAAAQAAAKCTPELVKRLYELIGLIEGEDDLDAGIALNQEFHKAISDAAGNPTVASFTEIIRARSSNYEIFEGHNAQAARTVSNESHRNLAAAIAARDPASAANEAAFHVTQTEHWLRLIKESTESS
jgi:GntR family transcriptional repressor for pyruvate dehydrogenase complex